MSVEAALYELVTGTNVVGDRMYPTRLPQRAEEDEQEYPAIAYTRISSPEERSHDDAPSKAQLVRARFQFDVWGKDRDNVSGTDEAIATARALVRGLNGFKGVVAGVRIDSILFEDDRPGFDETTGRDRRIVDAIVTHKEAA